MSAVQPYYTPDGRYITNTDQFDAYNAAHQNDPVTPYVPENVGANTFDDYRTQIKAGLISPTQALGNVQDMYKAPGTIGGSQDVSSSSIALYRNALAQAKNQLFAPLQVDSDYKFHRPGALDSSGDISLQGTQVNQSVTNGFGTNSASKYPASPGQAQIPGLPTIPQLG